MLGPSFGYHTLGRKSTFEELFFELRLGNFDLHSLVYLLSVPAPVVGVVLDCRGEKGIDEGGLSQARLASDL